MRDLDFDDPNSYRSGAINQDWRVSEFDRLGNDPLGWVPIGTDAGPFTAEFEGNGYAISNLQIHRVSINFQGLFGSIGNGGAVRNLGVANVDIAGGVRVGAIAGDLHGGGRIANSYATGRVSGNVNVGGLVGNIGFFTTVNADTRPDPANTGIIVNSRSSVAVLVRNFNGGGILGRCNGCTILNSFAVGSVTNNNNTPPSAGILGVGGFVGQTGELLRNRSNVKQAINISNNYAWGSISRSSNNTRSGAFLSSFFATGDAIINANYAIGSINTAMGTFSDRNVTVAILPAITVPNYYQNNVNVLGNDEILNTFARTAQQLRAATEPSTTATGVYYLWRKENWDFGTAEQYPTLKYTSATEVLGRPACLSAEDSTSDTTSPRLPVCGTLIAPKVRYGLKSLVAQGDTELSPPFDATAQNVGGAYFGTFGSATPELVLIGTAQESSATYTIYVNGNMPTPENTDIASGDPSGVITLSRFDVNEIVVEVKGAAETVRYTLYLRLENRMLADRDGDGFTEIYYLDHLHAIAADTTTLAGKYELMRDLNFDDPNSYLSGAINQDWRVTEFDRFNADQLGWVPIGNETTPFSGEFDGNDYAIYDLQIYRISTNFIGLFGVIDNGGAVRNLGVANVNITALRHVGAIAGDLRGGGRIVNSYATGLVGGSLNVGGLVGNIGFFTTDPAEQRPDTANAGIIVNSRSSVDVRNFGFNAGGILGRCNGCTILNSFAVGSVTNTNPSTNLPDIRGNGGFVGQTGEYVGRSSVLGKQAINISNNYAWGSISRSSSAIRSGAFLSSFTAIEDAIINANYAIGSINNAMGVFSDRNVAIRFPAITVPNYYENNVNFFGFDEILNTFARTAQQLRAATKPSTTATGVYYLWREENWDFGNDMQYPTLKHTSATDVLGRPACLSAKDPTSRLPVCGTLIAPKLRYGLESLVPLGDAGMDPPFDADALHIGSAYFGTVRNVAPQIALRATTLESSATYSVYVNDMITGENTNIDSGDPSGTIDLRTDGITEVVVEVNGSGTVRYTLYLEYQPVAPLPAVDADRDGLVEINYLEELAMLRLNLAGGEVGYRLKADDPLRVLGCPNRVCRGYELMRDLDFNDADSYRSGAINRSWVVHDFAVTTDTGWTPIGGFQPPGINTPRLRFTAEFDGNGYTISNLQINRDGRNYVGLFGNIGSEGVLGKRGAVRNLGLLDVRIEGDTHVGAIAGNLRGGGRIANSYATGSIEGNINVGGLVGNIGFFTTVFADNRVEPANTGIIVNSRSSVAVLVRNFNGGGILGRCNGCTILNSFAVGSVTSQNNQGMSGAFGTGGFVGQVGESIRAMRTAEQAINISNNYAWGNLIYISGNANAGTFIGGGNIAKAIISANYASGLSILNNQLQGQLFMGSTAIGGTSVGTMLNYSRNDTVQSFLSLLDFFGINGFDVPPQQLRAPTEPGTTPTDVYYRWREDNWDFGNDMQYPTLKYTAATDVLGSPACRSAGDTASPRLPVCGTLIAPKTRYGLSALTARYAQLTEPFDDALLDIGGAYRTTVLNDTPRVQLVATTREATATYSVYIGDTPISENINSDAPSGVIPLNADGTTEVDIEVHGTRTVRYTVYLDYRFETPIDADNDGLVDLHYLEDVAMVRFNFQKEIGYRTARDGELDTLGCPNGVCRGYELMRDLDFDDPASYREPATNRPIWTTRRWEFVDLSNAVFKGNGYAISNLSVLDASDLIALFAIVSDSDIDGLGLVNVDINSTIAVAMAASLTRSTIRNSYVIGELSSVGNEPTIAPFAA